MQTQTKYPITEEREPVLRTAPPTLVEEILEETKLRQTSGLFDLDRAAAQAKQRVEAHQVLMHAAISATEPIHWLWFKDAQGNVKGRFNYAGAARIGRVLGITVTPKGPVQIRDVGGKETAEVWGTASSVVLNMTYDNIRAYRVKGEDFLGRSTSVVGDNDWLQSAQTALITKGVRVLSGLVAVSPRELADVWGISEDEVVKQGGMGMGFSRAERDAVAAKATGTGKPATPPQVAMLKAKANDKLKEFPDCGLDTLLLLQTAMDTVCGGGNVEAVRADQVTPLASWLMAWKPNGVLV